MRTIKFRGKRIDGGGWIFGYYVRELNVYMKKDEEIHAIITKAGDYEVLPESVGQWTGLVDRHGREIFEHDVLRCVSEDYEWDYRTKVYAVGTTLCVDVSGQDYDYTSIDFAKDIWDCEGYDVEVLGNIVDNPELMEV